MTAALSLISPPTTSGDTAALELRHMVLRTVTSVHSKRNYAKAMDELFALCAERSERINRSLLMEYRASMIERRLSPSTINVRLAAVRKLVSEARWNGILGNEQAAQTSDIPNIREQGTRAGNWLTCEQTKELLAVPDRSTLKDKRDY